VKVFTVRNLSDVRKNNIFKRFYERSFHRCSIAVRVLTAPPFVNKPKCVWKNSSGYQDLCEDGMEMEVLKIIGYSLNLSLAIDPDKEATYCKSLPPIYVGGYKLLHSMKIAFKESSRNYLTIHSAWYMPCALKYP
jgi:MoaA/NifB/PqqE/SkfB family radical SAM enzyme